MKLQKFAALYYAAIVIFSILLAEVIIALPHSAYAHSSGTGTTKNIDKYKIVFQPHPKFASAGQNMTLNFSILENNSDVYNVNVALAIKEKKSDRIIDQMPYRFYEFSHISMPYTFQKNNTDYEVMLFARVNEDPKYLAKPLVAGFEVPVGQASTISLSELLLAQVVPFTNALVGGFVFLLKKKRGPQN